MNEQYFTHKSFLLPPIEVILHLCKIKDPISFLYKYSNSSLDIKTYRNIFLKQKKTHKQTISKFYSENLGLKRNSYFKSFINGHLPKDINLWYDLIAPFIDDKDAQDFFPLSRSKILEILKVEDVLLKEDDNITTELEVKQLLVSNTFIQKFISGEERKTILDTPLKDEGGIILIKLMMKLFLYIMAQADAEFSYHNRALAKDGIFPGEKSILKSILPKFENNKYIPSTEMLFRKWKNNSNTTSYTKMQKHIPVSGYSIIKLESQKRKFLGWRKGKKVAHDKDILVLLKGIFPQNDIENYKVEILFIYRVSIFLNGYIDYLLTTKSASEEFDLFKSDKEVVLWLEQVYSFYFNKVSHELEGTTNSL